MNKLKVFLATLLLGLFTSNTLYAGTYASENAAEYELNTSSPNAQQHQLLGSRLIKGALHTAILRYDFALQGGAIAAIPLWTERKQAWKLPKNAVIVGCIIDVITAPTSGGSATIALGTGQSATDLKAATAIATYTALLACVPVQTAASSIKLTADRAPVATVATATLTAGKFNVILQYVISD